MSSTFRIDMNISPQGEREYMLMEIRQLKKTKKEYEDILNRLNEAPKAVGQVVSVSGSKCLLQVGGNIVEVETHPDAAVGDCVTLSPNMQVVGCIRRGSPTGHIGSVVSATKRGIEVAIDGQMRILAPCDALKLKPGDVVVVDSSYTGVVGILPRESKLSFSGGEPVSWDDIGGNENAKNALRDAIETPWLHKEIFNSYGMGTSKGALLYGPPGCGKTMLAKAAATSLSGTHGRSDGFIYVKGPALLSKWVGQSESNIRDVFNSAREHKAKHGYPAIVFIDEADAVLSARGPSGRETISGTVVPQFLAEMDGLDDSGAFVMLATNRPDALDSAVTRDGRIDRKVCVERPGKEESKVIAKLHLKGKPLHAQMDTGEASAIVVEQVWSDERKILDIDGAQLWLRNSVSGAMIANVVKQASMMAVRRDVASKKKKASGISAADIELAVDAIHAGTKSTDLRGVFMEAQATI